MDNSFQGLLPKGNTNQTSEGRVPQQQAFYFQTLSLAWVSYPRACNAFLQFHVIKTLPGGLQQSPHVYFRHFELKKPDKMITGSLSLGDH